MMTFKNNREGNGGYIELLNGTENVGRLTYTIIPAEEKLIVSYVMVYPQYEGQGMGKSLVEESIKFARENSWKIQPHCSYAHAVMRRMEGIEDVFA